MDGIHSQTVNEVRWCSSCRQHGQKSRLKKFQINFDECICLCSHAKCPSEVENPSSSSVILKRKASEIPNLRKRRKNVQPDATATGKLANRHQYDSVLLLQNEDALCWLDSSILLVVFCESLRECLDDLPGDGSLKRLCREFDNAQKKFQTIYSSDACAGDNENRSLSTVLPENVRKTSVNVQTSYCTTRTEPILSGSAESLEDSLDLMKFLEEDTSAESVPVTETSLDRTSLPETKLPVGGNSLVPPPKCQSSKVMSELSEPMSILKDMREKIWLEMQPQLQCEKGQEETPVFALPVLLRHNRHFEAHFETSYHWEFCCRACNITETTVGKSVMPSLKTVMKPLNMASPSILRPCYTCNAIKQRSKLIIHSLPACPMFHFIEGIPPIQSWSQLNFIHGGHQYLLSAIIQYKQNPNHFIPWIKDNRRNLWLQGDDLKSPISHWSREEPTIPSSEVHVVLWERQGDCRDCSKLHTTAQCIIETDNLDLIKPFHHKEGFSHSLTLERFTTSRELGMTVPQHKQIETVVQKPARSKSSNRRELSSWLPKMKVVGNTLSSKFALLSESLPSCAEYREKMARARRRSELSGLSSSFRRGCDRSRAGSLRSLRLGSVSPMSSPSGSSESCSLPDSCQSSSVFPELDDFIDEFLDKHVMSSECQRDGEVSLNFPDFLEGLDL